jgi:ABC-type nitrate/sulfonate/bicarbonate transport system substrate-binding protein
MSPTKRIVAAVVLMAALGCRAANATPLRISYAAIASNTAGIWMAEGSGAFKRQGLDAQFVYISSSATNVQELLAGSIDVMAGGSSGVVSATAHGAPIVAVALSVIAVSRNYLQTNRPTVERVVRAYVDGVAAMVHNKAMATKILAKYLQRSDPAFLDETYVLVRNYTGRVPRVDPRVVPLLLEFDTVKGVDAEALTAKAIDNSIVDQLVEEKFIQKLFGKELP